MSLGGASRELVQVKRAKDQLRAAVAAGTITQARANAEFRRSILHFRELRQRAGAFRSELRVLSQLAAGQAVASAVPGIGGFALGTAIGRSGGLAVAGGVVGGIAGAAAAGQLAFAGDQLRLLEAQLRAFTPSAQDAERAFGALISVSRETGTAIRDNAVLLRRLIQAQQDLNASTADVVAFQEIVQKLMIASGAATSEASAGTLQLSQALASGKVQGDEFRSIMENMTAVARAAAQGLFEMGKLTRPTIGELNKLRETGALTAKDFFQAVLTQGAQANRLFGAMPDTIGRAAAGLSNEFFLLTGRLGEITGATDGLINVLRSLEGALLGLRNTLPSIGDAWEEAFPASILETLQLIVKAQQQIYQQATRSRLPPARLEDETGELFRASPTSPRPELLRRRISPYQEGIFPREEQERISRGNLALLAEQAALTQNIVAAQLRGADAVRETEIALEATLEARKRGLSIEADEVQQLIQIRRLEDAIAVAAAKRQEIISQEGLRAETVARGQQTEQLRIQLRLLEAREEHGEAALALLFEEIVATERLRTERDRAATTLGLEQQLEDIKLSVKFAGQETEEYRIQAQLLEIKRQQLSDVTAEQEKLVQAIQKETTARNAAVTRRGIEFDKRQTQLSLQFAQDSALLEAVGLPSSEDYRVQRQLLQLEQQLGSAEEAKAFEPQIRQAEALNTQLELMESTVPSLASAFSDLAQTAIFEDMDSAAEKLSKTIIKLTLDVAILRLTMAAAGLATSSYAGSTAPSTVGVPNQGSGGQVAFVPSGRQHGGRVMAGRGYIVGEAGREYFEPDQPGRIISNRELERRFDAPRSMQQVNVSVAPQVHVHDERTSSTAQPVETEVDAFGIARVFIRDEIASTVRSGQMHRALGVPQQGFTRG